MLVFLNHLPKLTILRFELCYINNYNNEDYIKMFNNIRRSTKNNTYSTTIYNKSQKKSQKFHNIDNQTTVTLYL